MTFTDTLEWPEGDSDKAMVGSVVPTFEDVIVIPWVVRLNMEISHKL